MDYRNRKYYLATFQWTSYEMRIANLKMISPALKINPPYNHFKNGKEYDGENTKGKSSSYWQMMISCNKKDAEAVEYELRKAARNERNSYFLEITKEMCGQ